MAQLFLRRLNHHEAWVEYQSKLMEGDAECPLVIRQEIDSSSGMSVFAFGSDAEQKRIAASLMLIRSILPFRGIAIRSDVIKKHGFEVQCTPDNAHVFDTTIRSKHFDILPTAHPDPVAFAKTLAKGLVLVQYEIDELMSFINKEMKKNSWHRKDVYREIKIPRGPNQSDPPLNTGKVMADHWHRRYLSFSVT